MGIDIFSIKPNVVTRDLSGKSFLIYGERKSGKTTNACKFPKPILLGFEKGYGFLDGIIAQPINTWKEALEVKKQNKVVSWFKALFAFSQYILNSDFSESYSESMLQFSFI